MPLKFNGHMSSFLVRSGSSCFSRNFKIIVDEDSIESCSDASVLTFFPSLATALVNSMS